MVLEGEVLLPGRSSSVVGPGVSGSWDEIVVSGV